MGHYQIGPRIGTGGMAEVYLGTQQAIGGFRKLVVMKRLLGWQRGDGEAIESLLDEARIAATINHPNIVTTLDIGLDRDSPYIVLEYLSGEDLRYVLQQLHERDAMMPLGVVCRIGASIAAALAQAHDVRLPDGSSRSIVHRDVTPSNIIVCYSGVTKLVDFGVARVSDADPKTKQGVVKGKFSYLAPEQLSGDPLDGRTDVFQLGIVLWEMVTMRRLFEGKTDHERLNAVMNRTVARPSLINHAVPACLDRTIMRALERNPARRQQSAHELEEELLEAIGAIGSSGGDHSVAKWMQAAFAKRQEWRIELERRTVAEADAPVDEDVEIQIDDSPDSPWWKGKLQTGPRSVERSRASGSASSLRGLAVEASVAKPRRGVARYMIPAVIVIGAAVSWLRFGHMLQQPPRESGAPAAPVAAKPADYDVDLRVLPATATIAVDGNVLATGRYRATFAADGAPHTVTFSAPGHTTVQRRFEGATTLEINLEPLAPAEPVAAGDEAGTPVPAHQRPTAHRPRARVRGPQRHAAPPATAASEPTNNGSAAPAPPKPKATSDSFAPASDNIDPFATGD